MNTQAPATRRPRSRRSSLPAHGEPMLWLTGGALVGAVVMILGLLILVVWQGTTTFWPVAVPHVTLHDGQVRMGEVTRQESFQLTSDMVLRVSESQAAIPTAMFADVYREQLAEIAASESFGPTVAQQIETAAPPTDATFIHKLRDFRNTEQAGSPAAQAAEQILTNLRVTAHRRLFRTANFDLTNTHFTWVSDHDVATEEDPEWAIVVERLLWGRFYGFPAAIEIDGQIAADARDKTGDELAQARREIWELFTTHHDAARKRFHERRHLEKHVVGKINYTINRARLRLLDVELKHGEDSPTAQAEREAFAKLQAEQQAEFARIQTQIAELNATNAKYRLILVAASGQQQHMELGDIVRAYPANQLTTPGRMATYLSRWKEFPIDEPREANMEGGVFPAIFGTFVMTLLMSMAVVPFGVLAALYLREYAKAGTMISIVRIAINNLAGVPSIVFGVFGLGFFCYLVGGTIDQVFFQAKLPSPTFGTGGVLWASLTLALLTLPVVIVATEESLAAVPNSMREGSYACGASKWQTIKRIVLPRAMPGIMTGMILAMARGAGEVAPLMLVGAVKLAPELPVDGMYPYVHPERSFMHLGFHIFDLGFQSQNSEAAKPMVFTTTLLLIGLIALLNISAIWLRARLRRKFVSAAF